MDIGYTEEKCHEIILAVFASVFIMTGGGVLNVITKLKDNHCGIIALIVGQ